ncbi:conserved membrane protein of unknown function [Tenacibaculum sp. 190130A14a]|uniref:DUF3667 domain-containing protein n=1 Tax=Tenacibaculum polynesiense TaxID=3137857 RepID=A0ABP1F1N3_9FLAO
MNCKNCNEVLENEALFCDHCGAKVIKNRISLRFLLGELFASMGFESIYFLTLKKMIIAPHEVIQEYLEGVRKRYINPFAYLAVGAAVSLIIFNYFSEDYLEIQSSFNKEQIAEVEELANKDLTTIKDISKKDLEKLKAQQGVAKMQLSFLEKWSTFLLKYFNISTFLFLPFYALLSKLTYNKRHNYGEHIVANAYLQGTTMYTMILCFLLSMLVHPRMFGFSMLIVVLYYLYTFAKLYQLSFAKSIVKFLKFILMVVLLSIPLGIILIFGVAIFMFKSNPGLFQPA